MHEPESISLISKDLKRGPITRSTTAQANADQNKNVTVEKMPPEAKPSDKSNPLNSDPEGSKVDTQTGQVTGQDVKTPDVPDKNKDVKRESKFKCIVWIFIIPAVFAFIVFKIPDSGNVYLSQDSKRQAEFEKDINAIVGMLSNTESNLNSVSRTLKIFIKEGNHEKPAIVLLISTKFSSSALADTLHNFVEALKNFYDEEAPNLDEGYIKAEEIQQKDENEGKAYIENVIEAVVKSGKHLIIMKDIDKFPVSCLSKVHAYLDHENPPHKDVVYILTAVTGYHDIEGKKLSQIAQEYFDDQWGDYDEDHRRPLMGRMASVIGLISKAS